MSHLPQYVIKSLNSASGVNKCFVNSSKVQDFLTDKLGLVTDDNEHRIENFIVDFCWVTQKWFVKF